MYLMSKNKLVYLNTKYFVSRKVEFCTKKQKVGILAQTEKQIP